MKPDKDTAERIWEKGFEGHAFAQMKRLAKLPFSQKLEWLEEAHYLVLQLQATRRKSQGNPTFTNINDEE